MTNQSKILTGFYIAYNMWLETGAPDRKPFSRRYGLCGNLESYFVSIGTDYYSIDNILTEMNQQFYYDAGIADPVYPFGGKDVYDKEQISYTLHLNPDRIKWVKNHLA